MINRADWVYQSATGAAISTSATTLLSKPVVSGGVYYFKFLVSLVNVGSPTNINFGLSGPTMSACNWQLERYTGSGSALRLDIFTSLADAVAGTAVVTTWARGEGTFVATSTANFNVRGIRVSGTSSTVQAGSVLGCERIG